MYNDISPLILFKKYNFIWSNIFPPILYASFYRVYSFNSAAETLKGAFARVFFMFHFIYSIAMRSAEMLAINVFKRSPRNQSVSNNSF